MAITRLRKILQGFMFHDSSGVGLVVGDLTPLRFPRIAALADGVALTTTQANIAIHRPFRLRGGGFALQTCTAVAAGTDPAFDIYKALPIPAAPTAALESPAIAGNVDDGAHDYAVGFESATGAAMPSAVTVVTVADKSANGKVRLVLPIGPVGTTKRTIYRSKAGAHQLYKVASVSDNTTLTYLDNTADSGISVVAPIIDASAETIFTGTVKGSATTRSLCSQYLAGTLTVDQAIALDPCEFSLRVATGASSGALTNLDAYLFVEYVPS